MCVKESNVSHRLLGCLCGLTLDLLVRVGYLLLNFFTSLLVLFQLAPLIATRYREELDLELIDAFLELGTHIRIKAVDKILLQVTDDAGLRVAVVVRAVVNQTEHLAPRLSLSVLGGQTVKKFARHNDLVL